MNNKDSSVCYSSSPYSHSILSTPFFPLHSHFVEIHAALSFTCSNVELRCRNAYPATYQPEVPLITIRKANERGHSAISWLDSWHSFSFSDYYDPNHMGFRALRVVNDDRVAPSMGFGTHPHRDMEIVTYVLSGALEHKDSLGNGDVLRPGDVQCMSAGTGIRHSEFNPSSTEAVHLLQIWIQPDRGGGKPGYGQKHFSHAERHNQWRMVVNNTGSDGALKLAADAAVLASVLSAGKSIEHALASGRHAWLHVATGTVIANGIHLSAGDALALSDEPRVTVIAEQDSEMLLFDLK